MIINEFVFKPQWRSRCCGWESDAGHAGTFHLSLSLLFWIFLITLVFHHDAIAQYSNQEGDTVCINFVVLIANFLQKFSQKIYIEKERALVCECISNYHHKLILNGVLGRVPGGPRQLQAISGLLFLCPPCPTHIIILLCSNTKVVFYFFWSLCICPLWSLLFFLYLWLIVVPG